MFPWKFQCPQDSLSEEDDHICTIDLPQEETITKAYSETCDEIRHEHNDDSVEGLLPCDLFSEEDNYDHEEGYSRGFDLIDENSPFIYKDGHDDY